MRIRVGKGRENGISFTLSPYISKYESRKKSFYATNLKIWQNPIGILLDYGLQSEESGFDCWQGKRLFFVLSLLAVPYFHVSSSEVNTVGFCL
jgi:hypothetical protein